ncbi:T9SS type A sorting domain-containing protein [Brumimicrobium aurantiacum]|uniref:T9SS C-terminal target domain-containing protein n=1 Tax=Brumimicrobium aurantiacum TaxID=1737063 RepID=A0A3E1EXN7_9FLAO|nr:T9SS type A sorting domain-containing protein [Brumimicrobium aurantiacum]RFC54223.1 T9SS C-terminal target domain-containing protein [Brumimicrobium aurantiacum]
MRYILLILIILYPLFGYNQIPVVPGWKMHTIDSVRIDYGQNPTKVFIRERNNRVFYIKRLSIEVLSADTLAVNLFYIDCSSYFIGQLINDTIIDVPQGLNPRFNLIVRTYKDTNTYFNGNCPERDFYTLTDSAFVSEEDSTYSPLSSSYLSKEEIEISLFPNPVTTQLYVDYPSAVKTLNYSIYNTQGKQLLYGEVEEFIDVSGLNKGAYIIHFEGKNGIATKRFIVK